jgi:hypothetical protein
MMEQQLELNVRREREISELTIAIDGLEHEIAKQKADIAVLESQLQRPFTAPDHRLVKEINIPPSWTADSEALIRIVASSSFLFSMAFFDHFLFISFVQDMIWALTIAFEDFSQFPGKEWQLMAVFVLGMVFNEVIYDENRANLEQEIRRLRSRRGQLTHRCLTLRKHHENDLLQCRTLFHQLRSRSADQEQQILTQSREMEMVVSSESEIRVNLFREMITLAKSHTTPRYSKNLYYAAAVILFRSCSTDEFVRTFLPLPSPRAVYAHFWSALAASRDHLQSLDAMIAYLSVQLVHSPELIEALSWQ